MCELEKWLKEKGYNTPAHNDAYELGVLDGAKEGWIAALKWVLPVVERLEQEACYDIENEIKSLDT